MSFQVRILGSGAALPTSLRNPSSQYILCNDRHLLIDCGEGTQNQMRKFHVPIQKINHILISHLHGDHFFGLVGLLSSLHLLGRDKGITIYSPPGLEKIIRIQLEISGAQIPFDLTFVELTGNESKIIFEDKLIQIIAFPLKHRIPTYGYKIQEKEKELPLDAEAFESSDLSRALIPKFKNREDVVLENGETLFYRDYTLPAKTPKSYAYCSDTIYTESILETIYNVDLLYHEATFLHDKLDRAKATMHTTAKQAAELALKANVKKLILGHLSARYESGEEHTLEAQPIFSEVQTVNDGDLFEIH